MKKWYKFCKPAVCLVVLLVVSLIALKTVGVIKTSHNCNNSFTVNKEYKTKPYFSNNSKEYLYQIGDFSYYKKLQEESPDKFPEYVLKQDSITMFDTAYNTCKNLDLNKDQLDYLVTEDPHETLSAHILFFLSDVATFDHYHRLTESDIQYSEKDTVAPDLEVFGKDGTVYSFLFNDDNTRIASMEIYNKKPNKDAEFLLKDYFITDRLSSGGISKSGYTINNEINDSSFTEFLLDRTKYEQGTVDHTIYNNKTFYSMDIDGDVVVIHSLPEFNFSFISKDAMGSVKNNPHADKYNTIIFK